MLNPGGYNYELDSMVVVIFECHLIVVTLGGPLIWTGQSKAIYSSMKPDLFAKLSSAQSRRAQYPFEDDGELSLVMLPLRRQSPPLALRLIGNDSLHAMRILMRVLSGSDKTIRFPAFDRFLAFVR